MIIRKSDLKMSVVAIGLFTMASVISGCGGGSSSSDSEPVIPRTAIVANSGDDTATIFNANTLAIEAADITLSGTYPHEIVLSLDKTTAYIMFRDSNNISILDIATGTETGTIALSGSQPSKAVVAPNGFLYVTYLASDFISKVDIAAATPVEDSAIDIIALTGGAIAVTPDGSKLYVGSNTDPELTIIDISTVPVVTYLSTIGSIADIKIDSSGIAFIASMSANNIKRLDTVTNKLLADIRYNRNTNAMTDLVLQDGKVFVAANSVSNTGGIVEAATNFDSTDYVVDARDDSSYDVTLPFTFTFQGTDYTTVSHSSNGSVNFNGSADYDVDVGGILGFAPNLEDLDSNDGQLLQFSSRLYSDHAVFQWLTATNGDASDVNDMSIFEVVLYNDGRARFDYLLSGHEAVVDEDDGYSYGVGDGAGTSLVNLRTTEGSPFEKERVSYLWNPASPNVMSSVPFVWEGTGIHFNPAKRPAAAGGEVDGVAVTSSHIFMAVPNDYANAVVNEIVVYDRSTMLPIGPVVVGNGPRAIVIAE